MATITAREKARRQSALLRAATNAALERQMYRLLERQDINYRKRMERKDDNV